jgi:hypothetical protein
VKLKYYQIKVFIEMKFIKASKFSILLALMLLIISITACQKVPEEFAASDKYRLVWNDDPTSTMTIAWDQLEGNSAEVLFDTVDYDRKFWKYNFTQKPSVSEIQYEMNTHFAKLENLNSDTKYYFVLKDEIGVSKRYWFKTAPDKPKAFTFIAGGDTKSAGTALKAGRASNRLVAKLRPLFILFSGDFTPGSGTDPDNWKQWLDDWFTQTTAEDGRMFPIIPIHGNHENGNQKNLVYIFNAPYQNSDSINVYYSLSFGGDFFHIMALNSDIETGGKQLEWIENDMKQHKDYTFKIAGYHKPFLPHTTTKREQKKLYQRWAGLFYNYRLSVSFDADSHLNKITYPLRPDTISGGSFMGFVRDDVNGTMFAGEGSWGASPRKADDNKPWTLTSGTFNQFKWVHVLPETKENQARMKIHTVISSDFDDEKNQRFYFENVEALTEKNLFKVPENINLHRAKEGQDFIPYPYISNTEN